MLKVVKRYKNLKLSFLYYISIFVDYGITLIDYKIYGLNLYIYI